MNSMIPEIEYRICVKNLPIVTVELLILNEKKDQVLLFKRCNAPLKDVFYSPGGRMLKNELFIEAIVRVAQKELGLKVDPESLIQGGIVEEIFENSIYPEMGAHCINKIYGTIAPTEIESILRFDDQHQAFQWFSVNDPGLHPYLKIKMDTLEVDPENRARS